MFRFSVFPYKDALYRIASDREKTVRNAIREARNQIEMYIREHQQFLTALTPLSSPDSAPAALPPPPEIVRRMISASEITGVGPMAAVAGAVAQAAAEAALAAGAGTAVIENGGDLFIAALGEKSPRTITVGLYAGAGSPLNEALALRVTADMMPAALCSSSSNMGHSMSFGRCDLATVFSSDAALADACATRACNMISSEADMEPVMERIAGIPGVRGILCVLNRRFGMAGDLPELTAHADSDVVSKITRHSLSSFPGNGGGVR